MPIDVTSLYNRRADHRWDRVCVGDILERVTWSRPDKVAITGWPGAFGEDRFQRLTYRQANDIVNQFANGLLARGLQRGDRVLLICENSVEAYLAKLGTAKAGLVAVPVNPSLATDVLAHAIRLAAPRLVVVDAQLWPGVAEHRGSGRAAAGRDDPDRRRAAPGGASFSEFLAAQPAAEPDVPVHGDDIWEILFTSGTTAMPKGVMLSHSYAHLGAYAFALSLSRGLRIESDLRLCAFLPVIYHVADQVLSLPAFLCGGSLVIGRHPVPQHMAQAITEERVTALWGGSPQLVKGLAAVLSAAADASAAGPDGPARSLDATSLQVLVYGWGAVEPAVRARLQELCGDAFGLVGIFGQTEAISCHRFWPDAWEEKYQATAPQVNYVGIPNPLLGSTVLGPGGEDLLGQPGVPGEAVYRSPACARATTRTWKPRAGLPGWLVPLRRQLHRGRGRPADHGGPVQGHHQVRRRERVQHPGGGRLHQHPGVAKAAVVGLEHDRWGEAVTAIVIPQAGRAPRPSRS